MEKIIWILQFDPDNDDSGLGATVAVFEDRDKAGKFAKEQFRFLNLNDDDQDEGLAVGVDGELFELDEDEEGPTGRVQIYSSFLR